MLPDISTVENRKQCQKKIFLKFFSLRIGIYKQSGRKKGFKKKKRETGRQARHPAVKASKNRNERKDK